MVFLPLGPSLKKRPPPFFLFSPCPPPSNYGPLLSLEPSLPLAPTPFCHRLAFLSCTPPFPCLFFFFLPHSPITIYILVLPCCWCFSIFVSFFSNPQTCSTVFGAFLLAFFSPSVLIFYSPFTLGLFIVYSFFSSPFSSPLADTFFHFERCPDPLLPQPLWFSDYPPRIFEFHDFFLFH